MYMAETFKKRNAATRKHLHAYWESLDDDMRGDHDRLLRQMAKRFNIPEPVIAAHIGEWEAGKE